MTTTKSISRNVQAFIGRLTCFQSVRCLFKLFSPVMSASQTLRSLCRCCREMPANGDECISPVYSRNGHGKTLWQNPVRSMKGNCFKLHVRLYSQETNQTGVCGGQDIQSFGMWWDERTVASQPESDDVTPQEQPNGVRMFRRVMCMCVADVLR